jgi:superfamily II DNA or RNA helicase
MFTLRDYQETVVEKNLDAKRRGVKAVLNGLFTGAGKTVIFCTLADRIDGRTLIICPQRELVWQAVNKVREVTGSDPDIEMADYRADQDDWWQNKVVVASKQTLLTTRGGEKRYKRFSKFELVIVDEAHMMCSPHVTEMLQHFQNEGAMVSGFTATPFRMDGKPLLRRGEKWSSTRSSCATTTCDGQSTTDGPFHPSAN